jgi:hypothetical protein
VLSRALRLNGRVLVGVLLAAISVGVFALTSAPAVALSTHVLSSSFGSEGPGAGELSSPDGVAVNANTHDVYVADRGNHRVDEFSSSGSFIRAWGWGVADGMPALETCTLVCGQGLSGSGAGQFTTPSFVAVDNSKSPSAGDVYVGDTGDGLVSKFTAEGALVKTWGAEGQLNGSTADKGPFGGIAGIAVDSLGTLLVINEESALSEYAQEGTFTEDFRVGRGTSANGLAVNAEGAFFKANGAPSVEEQTGAEAAGDVGQLTRGESTSGIAVDSATGDVYVAERAGIGHYASRGPHVFTEPGGGACTVEPNKGCLATDSFGSTTLTASTGLAVDPTSAEVYVADTSAGKLYGFVPAVLPDVSTEAPTSLTATGGTMNGSVNPDGLATTYQFEYGPTTAYGSVTPSTPATVGSDSTTHHLIANLTGLEPGFVYHYRIIATNSSGTNYGADQTLATHGPPTILTEQTNFVSQHTALFEVAVNPHGLDTHYEIEYGTSNAYGSHTTPADLGSEGEALHAYPEVTGLAISTTYHFRVTASNAEGTTYGSDQTFTTEPAASATEEAPVHVGATSVTLNARANDYETAATYYFEYGTTTAYGSTTPATALAASENPKTVTAALTALQSATSYHFRLVVEAEAGTVHGPDDTFTTHPVTAPSLALPDGRGYEKVSPTDNAGSDVYQDASEELVVEGAWTLQPFVVSPDGSKVAYIADPSERGGTAYEGGGGGNQYLATRLGDGSWSAANVDPPSGEREDRPVYRGFSTDLSVGFVDSNGASALAEDSPGERFSVLYAKTFSTGSYDALVRTKPEHRTPEEFSSAGLFTNGETHGVTYAGSSADLDHELFIANDALTANAVDGGAEENNLYDSNGNVTTLVNILPDGSTEPNATFGGPALPYAGEHRDGPMLAHDISADGSRIFWTDLTTHNLYVRENDTAPQSPITGGLCTVPADACTVLIADNAQFYNATPDGSTVLYSVGGDLYEHNLDDGQTVDLAPHGSINGVVAASEDLSYVYFVAKAALAVGAEPVTCEEGHSTPCNLYVAHVGEPVRFIDTLSSLDNRSEPESTVDVDGDWQGSLGHTEAETTPDGAHLLFVSAKEIYMYDFTAGRLFCVSCKPDGEASGELYPAFLPVSHVDTVLPRWVSDDGDRVFFDAETPLVPQDTNKATDVYEWERGGSGSCTQSPGCIYMLSDGTSAEGSYLIGASTSGDDVFFTTRGRLVAEDENENIDVYDAHADMVTRPSSPRCTGSGCQGLPSAPPIFTTPPSVTYNGVGNFELATATTRGKQKPLTRAQKLAKALKACEAKAKGKRASCAAQAEKKYGPKKKKKSASLGQHRNVKQSSERGK